MARSRPTAQDHEAVVMEVGDPPPRDDRESLSAAGGSTGRSDAGRTGAGPTGAGPTGAGPTPTSIETGTTVAHDPPPGDETTMAPVSMDVDGPDDHDDDAGDDGHDGRGPRRWMIPALVVSLVVAAGLAAWNLTGDESVDEWWGAPAVAVTEQWSIVGTDDGYYPVILVGDDVLVQRPSRSGNDDLLLQRRDGRTGDVEWSVPQDPGDLVVVVDEGQAVNQVLFTQRDTTRLVGVSAATGEELWSQDANGESWAGLLPTGELWVTGDQGCGLVHAPTGRFLFTVGEPHTFCQPAGDGLLWENDTEWVLVDASGEVVGRVPTNRGDAAWPIVVDDMVVRLDGRDLVASDAAGVEQWRTGLEQGPWWWMSAFGDDEMVVVGDGGTLVVDRADGGIVGRAPGQPQPLVTEEGQLRLLLDRSGMSEGEAAGVWSRSPDAATFALLDGDGAVLGTQDIVVTSWPVVTPQGVLVAHGPDDRRRLSLFDPDDLSERWQVPIDLRQGEVMASNTELVVLQGSRDGDVRVVVYAPEG